MRFGAIRAWSVMVLAAAGASGLQAHPMGNYSVSHYTKIVVERDGARMDYVLDLAEIPTFELMRQWELERNSPREALDRRATQQAREWVSKLRLTVNGHAIAPRFESARLTIEDGAGGVPVMRIASRLKLPAAAGKLEFEDSNYTERAGWKEIVIAAAGGATIERASHSDQERSQGLTAYPQDPAIAPPQDLKASVEWSVRQVSELPGIRKPTPPTPNAGPVTTPAPVTASTPPQPDAPGAVVRGDYLSRMLLNREITLGTILIGMAVAFGLGSAHALSPGHGKTIVAAYLVGARGTWRHALFLGGMVTFTHTISVFFLGFVTQFLSEYVAPETLSPILAAISGISIVWIGGMLLIQRVRRLRGHHDHGHGRHHDHGHGHDHHHHDHDHHHGPGGHTHVPEGDVSLGSLIALGASGGLVPCPSALVLLLSAISIQRVGLGMVLLVAFSAGLAAVLSGIGLLVLYAKHLLPSSEATSRSMAFRVLPVVSAGVILCVGLVMTGVALGIIQPSRILG